MKKSRFTAARRVLSIALSLLMLMCAMPMMAFADDFIGTTDPPLIADVAGVEVLARSAVDMYVVKSIPASQEKISFGMRLGDFTFSKTAANLRQSKPDGSGYLNNYKVTTLTVRFENEDQIVDRVGVWNEPVIIYVTKEPTKWVKINYTFEIESAIAPAEITSLPSVGTPVVYEEGLKASDLALVGGEAMANGETLEGTFAFANPDQAMRVGANSLEVVFTPADPAVAEPATATITVQVEKGTVRVDTAPTVTMVYGSSWASTKFVGAVTSPASGVTFDWYGLTGTGVSDEKVNTALAVGEHEVKARVRAFNNSNYEVSFVPVKVIVLPVTEGMEIVLGGSLHDTARTITVRGANNAPGTLKVTVNGKELEGAKFNEAVNWTPEADGATVIRAEYIPAEKDNYAYQAVELTTEVTLPRTVTVEGGTGSGTYLPGTKVGVSLEVESLPKYNEFKGWKATNANGETVDVGVADMTQPNITITVPGEDVTLTAQASFSINLFFQAIGQAFLNFFMKIAEFFQNLFSGNGIG